MSYGRNASMNNQRPLEGKLAIVTGASRGIGLAVARRIGELGGRLSLCSRTRSGWKKPWNHSGRQE